MRMPTMPTMPTMPPPTTTTADDNDNDNDDANNTLNTLDSLAARTYVSRLCWHVTRCSYMSRGKRKDRLPVQH
jgi:hypothetical protein